MATIDGPRGGGGGGGGGPSLSAMNGSGGPVVAQTIYGVTGPVSERDNLLFLTLDASDVSIAFYNMHG